MVKFCHRLSKIGLVGIFLILLLVPTQAQAQCESAPFNFRLTASLEDDQIIYQIRLIKKVDWPLTDLYFKIPLPDGTRFVEGNAQPTTEVSFDGQEVIFFTPLLDGDIKVASFTVEVTDSTQELFTTQAWLTWQGEQPGEQRSREVTVDTSRQPLNWQEPAFSALQLELSATVVDDTVTYEVYLRNIQKLTVRMWDVRIAIPIPEGATFVETETSFPFVADFDGREASFFAIEMPYDTEVVPLKVRVSTEGVTDPFLVTHAWASWKNAHKRVAQDIVAQGQARSGDVVIRPHVSQHVVADTIGDVPIANYDLTSIAFQEDGSLLRVSFYTAQPLGPQGQPLDYFLNIDRDCRVDTGRAAGLYGVDYRIRYNHQNGKADLRSWDPLEESWNRLSNLNFLAGKQNVVIWAPLDLLEIDAVMCWTSTARITSDTFTPNPPDERIPNPGLLEEAVITTQPDSEPCDTGSDQLEKLDMSSPYLNLTAYEPVATNNSSNPIELLVNPADEAQPAPLTPPSIASQEEVEEGYLVEVGDEWQYLKGYGEASYPIDAWRQVDYEDLGWFSGPTGIGYGNADDATALDDMRDNYVAVFMRRTFTVPDLTEATALVLEIDYDDSFIAYLNGTEVARRNIGEAQATFDTQPQTARRAGKVEVVNLTDFIELLQSGENVLAIQGHNLNSSANFSMKPALRWQYRNVPAEVANLVTSVKKSDQTTLSEKLANLVPLYGSEASSAAAPNLPPSSTLITSEPDGKIAVPLDNGQAAYDVHIFSVPEAQEIARITNARQPHFRFDGQRLLINREGGGTENIYEYQLADGTEQKVSDAPQDWHPFYDSWGNRVVYGNSELTVGSPLSGQDIEGSSASGEDLSDKGARKPFIFVQCGLLPPHQETEPRCRDIPGLGVLIPAGQVGEIQGTHPVWTNSDRIVYKGCNTWAGAGVCGIYSVPSSSTKGLSDGFIPEQLTQEITDIPTDTKGELVAFMSQRDGNWEAYLMNANGTAERNLSNSSTANDGLPAISPDGNWVAFVSDRSGQWAVWLVPVAGGPAEKLFDLPTQSPWGSGDRDWTNERISWGP